MPVSTSKAITLGLIAGLVGGLFGVGGGIIVVPGLVLWLGFSQHKASGTSVATIIASAGAALVSFTLDGSVDWTAALWVTMGAVVGAAIGTRILHLIPADTLRKAFSVLMLIAAARMAIT
ncbi:MAG: sulfite exporter TauE/SafE family protein [Actinomycetota bacterium]|nr:sulfite exporter TauE/SafE family protein [Actinomycetota bacterium]